MPGACVISNSTATTGRFGGRSRPDARLAMRAIMVAVIAMSLGPVEPGQAAGRKKLANVSPKSFVSPKSLPERRALTGAPPKCDPAKFRIVVDVGHTAESGGADSARHIPEFEFNLRLARRIEEKLKAEGFVETKVLVTGGKAKPSLLKRVAAANKSGADLFLSIHHDSVPDIFLEDWKFDGKASHFSDRFSGYSVFVSRRNAQFKASLKFATLLGGRMAAQDLQFARQYDQLFMGKFQRPLLDWEAGVYRYDDLVVLRRTAMPAVLLEAGSIINRDEELVMASPEHQDKVGAAVAGAVKEYCEQR